MTILLTGAAGFIGFHTAEALLARGDAVVGIDDLNPYYDVRLKEARLARLTARPGFSFRKERKYLALLDISEEAIQTKTSRPRNQWPKTQPQSQPLPRSRAFNRRSPGRHLSRSHTVPG